MPKITKELSTWFDYPDDPYNGKVHVRLVKEGELSSIRERTSEVKTQFVKEFRQKETVFRLNGTKEAIAIAAIIGWENFYNEKDEKLECTEGNIRIMCMESGFLDFIDECLSILNDESTKTKEEEAKN